MIDVMFCAKELGARVREAFPAAAGSCVTIGNFDGVHIGHQALLARARHKADQAGRPLVAVTFDPHPLELLAPDLAPPRLTDTALRLRLLQAAGVDATLLLPFTKELAAMPPEDFVAQLLMRELGMRDLLIGYDFSLGKGRSGTGQVLHALGQKLGFDCERFGPVLLGGEPVSSTRVRQAIRQGDMQEATALLGRPHGVHGPVVTGFRRGHTLGFPTANLAPPPIQLPPPGVYATWARLGIERFPAVTNIGNNPTFGGSPLTIEAHLLDFARDLYGQDLQLDFVQRLRGQITFDGPETLIRQIQDDIRLGRDVLAANVTT